jgi:metal-responsive CopG/Arc/MetJ family transcriptional regulator
MPDPRTSLNLPRALVKRAKHVAVEEGRTLSNLVVVALQKYLRQKRSAKNIDFR